MSQEPNLPDAEITIGPKEAGTPYNPPMLYRIVRNVDGSAKVHIKLSQIDSRVKIPFIFPVPPEAICNTVGKIALLWSECERLFDLFLVQMIEINNSPKDDSLLRGNFISRKARFRQVMAKVFSDDDVMLIHLDAVLRDMAENHWQRNGLLHGKISIELEIKNVGNEPVDLKVFLIAEFRHNGRTKELKKTHEQLELMACELAHIAGRFSVLLGLPHTGSISDRSPVDWQKLRDLLRTN